MTLQLRDVARTAAAACAAAHAQGANNRPLICAGWLACLLLVVPPPARAQETAAASHADHHPLIGRIWDVRAAQFIDAAELRRRSANAQFVLLGETHDNPEHHRLQKDLIAALMLAGRRPAIAMEQFDREHQAALDSARAERPRDADHLKQAAKFNDRGWQWAFYEPLVTLALEHDLPLIAANLSRADAFRIASKGLDTLGSDRILELGLDRPFESARRARLEDAIHQGHCGKAPPESLTGMVDAQRARDAVMAHAIAAHRERGAVLVAGGGHVRRDFGVPYYLERLAPEAPILSIGFTEILPAQLRPDDHQSTVNPEFDYLWFTQRTPRDDPCLQLKFKRE